MFVYSWQMDENVSSLNLVRKRPCLRRSQPKVRDLALNNSGGFQLPSLFRSLSVDRQ
jgi:hypothetical protein